MPDQDQNKPELNLDERIEELVTEMDEATVKLNKQIEEAALSDEEFNLQAEIGSGITPEEAAALRALEETSTPSDAPEAVDEPAPDAVSESVPEEPEAADTAPEPEPEPTAEAEPETETETESAPVLETEAAEPTPEATEPSPERTLDDQIDEMLEDAGQLPAEPEAKPTSAVDAVDAELAGLADEMLDGDFDDAEDIIGQGLESTEPQAEAEEPEEVADAAESSEENEEPAPEATDEQEEAEAESHDPDDLLDGDFDDAEDIIEQGLEAEVRSPTPDAETDEPAESNAPEESEAEAAAEQEPESDVAEAAAGEPDAQPESSEESEPALEDKPAKQKKAKKPRTPRQKRVVEPKADSKMPAFAAVALGHAGGIAFQLAEKVNKPLDSKPAYMKDIAGWLAAVTLFNAVAAWFFLLFLRSPAVGTSSEPTVELVGGTPAAQVEPEPIE